MVTKGEWGGVRNVLISLKTLLNVSESKSLLTPLKKTYFLVLFRRWFRTGFPVGFLDLDSKQTATSLFGLCQLSRVRILPSMSVDFELSLFQPNPTATEFGCTRAKCVNMGREEGRGGEGGERVCAHFEKRAYWSDMLRLVAGR